MKHDHSKCEHELKFCEHCDVVYCKKCKQEWGANSTYYPYTITTTTPRTVSDHASTDYTPSDDVQWSFTFTRCSHGN